MDQEEHRRTMRRTQFILSLWQEGSALPNAPPVWRLSLLDPHTERCYGFAEAGDLLTFLLRWMNAPPAGESPDAA